jgi:hypothetical protein
MHPFMYPCIHTLTQTLAAAVEEVKAGFDWRKEQAAKYKKFGGGGQVGYGCQHSHGSSHEHSTTLR